MAYLRPQDVLKTINIVSISDESGGRIKKDDTLIRIGDDDISTWALPRVVQRLSDFRVPVNTSVLLRFSRRVKIDGSDDEEEEEEQEEAAEEQEGEEEEYEEGEEQEEEEYEEGEEEEEFDEEEEVGEEEYDEEEDELEGEDGYDEEGAEGEGEEEELQDEKSDSPLPFDIDETIVDHSGMEQDEPSPQPQQDEEKIETFDIDESPPPPPAPVVEHYEPSADAEVISNDQQKPMGGLSSVWNAVKDNTPEPTNPNSPDENIQPQSANTFASNNLGDGSLAHSSVHLRKITAESQRDRDAALAEIEELRTMLQAARSENRELFKQVTINRYVCFTFI
jgi:hypothetical protein